MQQAKSLSTVNYVLYLILFISLICSFRAVGSISVTLILFAGITKNKLEKGSLFHSRVKNPFLICCCLLFAVHFMALIYTHDTNGEWNNIVLSSGLLFVPLAICCTNFITGDTRQKLLLHFCGLLAAASLFCLANAVAHYLRSGTPSVFFYHSLVSLFHQHAVYYSILVFIALAFLLENILDNRLVLNRSLHISSILFLSFFLFLLSSKLVIVFYLLFLCYHFILLIKKRTKNRRLIISSFVMLIIISILTLTIRNPISNRFYDAFQGDLTIIKQEKFNSGHYFNGIQFRLLQWEFTGELLNENNAWWCGVGAASSQRLLDQKYISKNMYTGDPEKGTKGYLGYNSHNQFLQTLLECGIPGLAILLTTCFFLVRIAWQKKRRVLTAVILLLLVWLFTESVLGRQFGIMIFCFFPLFLSFD